MAEKKTRVQEREGLNDSTVPGHPRCERKERDPEEVERPDREWPEGQAERDRKGEDPEIHGEGKEGRGECEQTDWERADQGDGEPAEAGDPRVEGEQRAEAEEPESQPEGQKGQRQTGEQREAPGEKVEGDESEGRGQPDPEELRNRVAELEGRLEERNNQLEEYKKIDLNYRERIKKIQAEFVSYRHRMERERIKTAERAERELIQELLPVIDNFERAIAASADGGENEGLASGVRMVYRQMMEVLEGRGLKRIPAEGEDFDPSIHEAVMQVEDDEYQSDQVVEELEKGYKYGDRVLRAAKVKVAR